jgi:hypothetical protein
VFIHNVDKPGVVVHRYDPAFRRRAAMLRSLCSVGMALPSPFAGTASEHRSEYTDEDERGLMNTSRGSLNRVV